jgi:hypothetical protein
MRKIGVLDDLHPKVSTSDSKLSQRLVEPLDREMVLVKRVHPPSEAVGRGENNFVAADANELREKKKGLVNMFDCFAAENNVKHVITEG